MRDYDELKRLALAATGGEARRGWKCKGVGWRDGRDFVQIASGNQHVAQVIIRTTTEADCDFIIAANPAAILELIAELEPAQSQATEAYRNGVHDERVRQKEDRSTAPPAGEMPDDMVIVSKDRSYDMRAAAIVHFNTAERAGKDRDDCLQAAWDAQLAKAPDYARQHHAQQAVANGEAWKQLCEQSQKHHSLCMKEALRLLGSDCDEPRFKWVSLEISDLVQRAKGDAELLDWLQDNFHSRPLDDFERGVQKLDCWSWMFYAPADVQGNIRDVLKAARALSQTKDKP